MGGFERWSEVIGGILTACGMGEDLLGNRAQMRAKVSPVHDEMQAFVLAWRLSSGQNPQTTNELWILCDGEGLLDTVRGAGNERSQRTRLGIALRGIADRIYRVVGSDGPISLQVVDAGHSSRTRAKTYKVVEV